jgi:hypothetical protein
VEPLNVLTITKTLTITAGGIHDGKTSDFLPPTVITTTTTIVAGDTTTEITDITTPASADSSGKGFSRQLRQQSANNMSALNSALETASEEVKPVLMQAIAVLENGYNNAIDAIGE